MGKGEKKKATQEFAKTLEQIEQATKIERMVKNNTLAFKVKGKEYRVRKPTYAEQEEVEAYRKKKYLEFVNDENTLFRAQWIEKYKKKGIDIEKMEAELVTLQGEIDNLMIRLAKVTSKPDVEKLKVEIMKLKQKQAVLTIRKTDLLSYSIEDQLLVAVNSYVTYIVLEHKVDKNWVRVFKAYKEFLESHNSEVINLAFYYINYIIYQVS